MARCRCEREAVLKTSFSTANPGRRYWVCGAWPRPNGCGFFEWFDGPVCQRGREFRNKLNRQIHELEARDGLGETVANLTVEHTRALMEQSGLESVGELRGSASSNMSSEQIEALKEENAIYEKTVTMDKEELRQLRWKLHLEEYKRSLLGCMLGAVFGLFILFIALMVYVLQKNSS